MQKKFTILIQDVKAEQVFDLIADIANYHLWLPHSDTFAGIHEISDTPIKQNTTYLDGEGALQMRGKIVRYQAPQAIKFQQSSRFKLFGFLPSGLDIAIDYVLVQEHEATTLIRNYELTLSGVIKLLRPIVTRRITAENERILQVMKTYLEKQT